QKPVAYLPEGWRAAPDQMLASRLLVPAPSSVGIRVPGIPCSQPESGSRQERILLSLFVLLDAGAAPQGSGRVLFQSARKRVQVAQGTAQFPQCRRDFSQTLKAGVQRQFIIAGQGVQPVQGRLQGG